METPEVGHLLLLILGVLISSALAVYVFAQIPLMELSVYAMLRNAILLVLGRLPRSVAAVFVIVLYASLIWYFFPYSLPLLLLGGAWCPLLLALMLVYSGLDEAFDIEKRIQSLHDGQRENKL